MSSTSTSLRDDIGGGGGGGPGVRPGGAAGFSTVSAYWETLCAQSESFTEQQRRVCVRFPATMAFVYMGAGHAIRECKRQFYWHRWNCSVEHSLLRGASAVGEANRPSIQARSFEPRGGVYGNRSFPRRRLPMIDFANILNQGTLPFTSFKIHS